MNIGLFAKGLDLMPDFGYPPVNFGGWESEKAQWYIETASHNTVVVDRQRQVGFFAKDVDYRTTLWATGQGFHAVRASAPEIAFAKDARPTQFERTMALVDIDEEDSYLLDIFRVVGGAEHAKFQHSHFGSITTRGLSLSPSADFGHKTQMRNFKTDENPKEGWSVDWKIEDRHRLLAKPADIHLRYTDLSRGVEASNCEGWISTRLYDAKPEEAWIPRIMVRRSAQEGPLASTFVSVVEPYEIQSKIKSVRRLELHNSDGAELPDGNVAVQVDLENGQRDLILAVDAEDPLERGKVSAIVQNDHDVKLEGEFCLIRFAATSSGAGVRSIALCRGASIRVGGLSVIMAGFTEFVEIRIDDASAVVISGDGKIAEFTPA